MSQPADQPAYDIRARLIRSVIISLRSVAGYQYIGMLEEAGLGRFSQQLPPDSDENMASSLELAQLTAIAYRNLNRSLAFILYRKLGAHTAMQYFAHPDFQQLADYLATLPEQQRLQAAMVAMGNMQLSSTQVRREVRIEDGRVHYLLQPCPYCTLIEASKEPVCYMLTEFYRVILRALLEQPVYVTEDACMKMGAAGCHFIIWT